MKVIFKKNGMTREVKAGFSWTVLFFGPFPFAFRGMWLAFMGVLAFNFFTLGFGGILMAFLANKMTAHYLLDRGWTIEERDSDLARQAWGVSK